MRKVPVGSSLMSLVAVFLLVTIGCAAFKGEPVVKYESGMSPILTQAPQGGTYELYDSTDTSPKVSVVLDRGDKVGFERSDQAGEVVAVAQSQRVRLPANKNYYWKRN
jgi:hypothetical protein